VVATVSTATDRTFFAGRQSYRSAHGFIWLTASSLAAPAHGLVVWMAASTILLPDTSLLEKSFAGGIGLLFGGMGLLWLWLAAVSISGVHRGGSYESSIRADAIDVGTPFGTRRYRWADIVDVTLCRRSFYSNRCDLAVIVKSGLGIGTNTIRIYSDRGITDVEFDQLYDQLVEQGLLPEDDDAS
jgi:PH (Pleckstrin Homology) domain-containing protein